MTTDFGGSDTAALLEQSWALEGRANAADVARAAVPSAARKAS